jgi:hypothetical protein
MGFWQYICLPVVSRAALVAVSGIHRSLGLLAELGPNVAHGHHADVVVVHPLPHVAAALRSHADGAKGQAIARRGQPRAQHRTRDNHGKS